MLFTGPDQYFSKAKEEVVGSFQQALFRGLSEQLQQLSLYLRQPEGFPKISENPPEIAQHPLLFSSGKLPDHCIPHLYLFIMLSYITGSIFRILLLRFVSLIGTIL
jgi:hypothetical protein